MLLGSDFLPSSKKVTYTGDLASYQENGCLVYEGRSKELIKYKNYHLYPLEIETIICKHPNVVEAGVFGRPEPTVQELVAAFVVKHGNVSEYQIIGESSFNSNFDQ